MKKTLLPIVIVLAVVAVIGVWVTNVNNRMVTYDEQVSKAWAQVENVYKRRMDLVPQLIATVQGEADYERSTLQGIVNARSHVGQTQVDPSNLSEESVKAYQEAQDQLSSALSRAINITVERYPTLAATQGFRDLQVQLEGTENRIAVERANFNEAVNAYNSVVRRFPTSLIASILGFERKGYFTAPAGAENPVDVKFEF
ncbi:MAG: LemA family protein [Bacteroidales bacterium]|nr:LemA family protein [Bacteroidales bacterium]